MKFFSKNLSHLCVIICGWLAIVVDQMPFQKDIQSVAHSHTYTHSIIGVCFTRCARCAHTWIFHYLFFSMHIVRVEVNPIRCISISNCLLTFPFEKNKSKIICCVSQCVRFLVFILCDFVLVAVWCTINDMHAFFEWKQYSRKKSFNFKSTLRYGILLRNLNKNSGFSSVDRMKDGRVTQ